MGIELRLLRAFATVAEEQHVGRAAARLFVSQPALSQQLRALEEQVGLPLFTRHPRGVRLTPPGEVLLEEACAVLGRAERLDAVADRLRHGPARALRVGVAPGLPATLVPELATALHERDPDAVLELRESTTPEQLDALAARELDLGILREPVGDRRLAHRTLLVEPLGASLPERHPLAARERVTLRELAGERFVCFPRAWAPALHDVLIEELRRLGLSARFQDAAHLSTTVGLVAAGQGVTLSAEPWLAGVPGVVWRPLAGTSIDVRTAAAWRPGDRAPLLATALDLLPPAVEGPAVAAS